MGLTTAFRDYVCTKVTAGTGNNYDPTNGYLSVGDSTTAFASSQTELQAATNRTRQQCSSLSASGNVITAVATFGSGAANHSWQEFGLFNAAGTGGPPVTGGTMMQRVASHQGTKASGSWQLTLTV